MEHKLIRGGEQWLPFARSRVRALRATGLDYASQNFDMSDGSLVHVRIVAENEYIDITGVSGGYVGLPADAARPSGVTLKNGEAVSPTATFRLSKKDGVASLSVKENVEILAGPIDWKNWQKGGAARVISFDHGMRTRYRVTTAQGVELAKPDIYVGGKKISTGALNVVGAALVSARVGDVKVNRQVIAVRPTFTTVKLYSAEVGSATWVEFATFTPSLQADDALHDPWFFSPTGDRCASLVTRMVKGVGVTRIVRCTIIAARVGGAYELTGVFTDGGVVGENTSSAEGFGPLPAPQPTRQPLTTGVWVHPNTGAVVVTRMFDQMVYATTDFLYQQSAQRTTTAIVFGVDYDEAGAEVLLSKKLTQDTGFRFSLTISGVDPAVQPGFEPPLTDAENSAIATGAAVGPYYTSAPGTVTTTGKSLSFVEGVFAISANNAPIISHTFLGVAGDSRGFSVNFYPVGAAPSTPISRKKYVVHDVDARNSSAVFEEISLTTTEVSSNFGPSRTARYNGTSKLKVVFEGVEVASKDILTVPAFTSVITLSQLVSGQESVVRGPGLNVFSWAADRLFLSLDGVGTDRCLTARGKGEFVASSSSKNSFLKSIQNSFFVTTTESEATVAVMRIKDALVGGDEYAKKFSVYGSDDRFRLPPLSIY